MENSTWWRDPEDMDEAQQQVIALPQEGTYLLTGKPGSGKTNLVVLRATYLIRSGIEDAVVLTFGRVISEFIISGARRHGLDDAHIRTFHGWAKETLSELGIEVELPNDFKERIQVLITGLQDAYDEGSLEPMGAILVDEVQDYPANAAVLFQSLSPRLFFAGDEHQRIYGRRSSLDAFAAISQEIELPYHYRNGRRICQVAAAIKNAPDLIATSRYDEDRYPSRARLLKCQNLDDQIRQAISEIQSQLRAYPNEYIGVLVPRVDDLAIVVETLRGSNIAESCQFQTAAEGYSAFDETRPVVVTSIHGGKGLEFRAAHLIGMDGLSTFPDVNRKNMAYTAVTRAKTSLNAYYARRVPLWFSAAFASAEDEPRPIIRLEDLFGE